MAELSNSTRSALQATYTPIERDAEPDDSGAGQGQNRAWDNFSFLRRLEVKPEEIGRLREQAADWFSGDPELAEYVSQVLELAEVLADRENAATDFETAARFAEIPGAAMVGIGQMLVEIRHADAQLLSDRILAIHDRYAEARLTIGSDPFGPGPIPLHGFTGPGEEPVSLDTDSVSTIDIDTIEPSDTLVASDDAVLSDTIIDEDFDTDFVIDDIDDLEEGEILDGAPTGTATMVGLAAELVSAQTRGVSGEVLSALQWARTQPDLAAEMAIIGGSVDPITFIGLETREEVAGAIAVENVTRTRSLLETYIRTLKVEPVGYLHLEKLTFTPAGTEKGELIYTVPLAPGEEIAIAHREWSNTSSELEEIVTDYQEDFSEEGVTEKTELAQSTESQRQHSNAFNMAVSASAGYGSIGMSASVTASTSLNITDTLSESESQSRRSSRELVSKASSRVKKEHKVSFRVAAASGEEEEAVRKIKNPSTDTAMRIDYFQMMRKWRVDLLRYGVRLTYDITIPEPGSDLMDKYAQIKLIDQALATPFGTYFPYSYAEIDTLFEAKPSELAKLFQKYGATIIEFPPPKTYSWSDSKTIVWRTEKEAETQEIVHMEFTFDKRYFHDGKSSSYVGPVLTPFKPNTPMRGERLGTIGYDNFKGEASVAILKEWVGKLYVSISLSMEIKPEIRAAWTSKTWNALKEAAEARFRQIREMLIDRRERLEDEIQDFDPLSLRKMEREEVTKNVLRWLIGPDFDFLRSKLPQSPSALYNADRSVKRATYGRVLVYGELIKFLHQAIEWENMLYMLYPYFWTAPERWRDKIELDHPDLMHRAFLKAGAARVVLPIRPGFEQDFASLIAAGDFNRSLPHNSRYFSISKEMKAFANTNYPGVPTVNPEKNVRTLISYRQKRAWSDIQILMKMLEDYRSDLQNNGTYPDTQAGLAALAPYGAAYGLDPTTLRDPWNNSYQYKAPGDYGAYDLASWGQNGQPGVSHDPVTGDVLVETADITSWAEASVIDTWYEFTPTSALDIALHKIPGTS